MKRGHRLVASEKYADRVAIEPGQCDYHPAPNFNPGASGNSQVVYANSIAEFKIPLTWPSDRGSI